MANDDALNRCVLQPELHTDRLRCGIFGILYQLPSPPSGAGLWVTLSKLTEFVLDFRCDPFKEGIVTSTVKKVAWIHISESEKLVWPQLQARSGRKAVGSRITSY